MIAWLARRDVFLKGLGAVKQHVIDVARHPTPYSTEAGTPTKNASKHSSSPELTFRR